MGTNYYAHWTPPGTTGVRITLHICKSLTMFNGQVFPTWIAWKDFLTHGHKLESVVIENEYGTTEPLDVFIRGVEQTTRDARSRQYKWQVENGTATERDWVDPYGFTFYAGEFS